MMAPGNMTVRHQNSSMGASSQSVKLILMLNQIKTDYIWVSLGAATSSMATSYLVRR
jgi:hypothetical protein